MGAAVKGYGSSEACWQKSLQVLLKDSGARLYASHDTEMKIVLQVLDGVGTAA
jgi:hypothetical protein